MFKTIAIVIVVALASLLIYAATRPDSFSIQRSTRIKATPEKIYALISDFPSWPTWSPWEKLDPDMKRTLTGAATGKGSIYEWTGSSKVGAGRMEITDVLPTSKVVIKLDFIKPFEGHNVTEFTLAPQGDTTEVNWVMTGPSPYISKLMGVFFNMDQMIGKDFEAGLANMKAAAEK
jgi:carbon monoxide dehydrogenase subunit G